MSMRETCTQCCFLLYSSNNNISEHSHCLGRRLTGELYTSPGNLISCTDYLLLSWVLAVAQVCLGAVSSSDGGVLVAVPLGATICVSKSNHNDS